MQIKMVWTLGTLENYGSIVKRRRGSSSFFFLHQVRIYNFGKGIQLRRSM